MKKKNNYMLIVTMLAFASILFFVPKNSNSQTNCAWECDQGQWIPAEPGLAMYYVSGYTLIGHEDCIGCEIRVYYRYRQEICSDGTTQIQYAIKKITLTDCVGCYMVDGLIDLAVSSFVRQMISTHGHPGINELVTFSMGTCWKGEWHLIHPSMPPEYIWEPCAEDCCKYEYLLISEGGIWPPTIIQTVHVPYTDCSFTNDPDCRLACKMQGWLEKKGIEDNSIDMGRSHVFPNPSEGSPTISFTNSETGIFDIQIINSQGKLVRKFQFQKNSEQIEFAIDLEGLANGRYGYIITHNGNINSEGSINLNK
ncbi:MAG: T9SS type A sorting domain-containing protein [Candidatus Kapabacteria bacterium]|nr:T9SS type A sorting domain-containing protein [Candidatus Kapabacteria bacterium]